MKTPRGYKIVTATLIALIAVIVLQRFIYSAFCMAKAGQVFWYSWDLWKQYYAWMPGKILCIALAVLVLALIIEAVYFIFCGRKK
jgi:uncharacterized membrane protein YgcG